MIVLPLPKSDGSHTVGAIDNERDYFLSHNASWIRIISEEAEAVVSTGNRLLIYEGDVVGMVSLAAAYMPWNKSSVGSSNVV